MAAGGTIFLLVAMYSGKRRRLDRWEAALLMMPSCLNAQQDTTRIIMQKDIPLSLVVKHDGTEFVGRILSRDQREILIETEEMGRFYIPIHVIRYITELPETDFRTGKDRGKYLFRRRFVYLCRRRSFCRYCSRTPFQPQPERRFSVLFCRTGH